MFGTCIKALSILLNSVVENLKKLFKIEIDIIIANLWAHAPRDEIAEFSATRVQQFIAQLGQVSQN